MKARIALKRNPSLAKRQMKLYKGDESRDRLVSAAPSHKVPFPPLRGPLLPPSSKQPPLSELAIGGTWKCAYE